MVAAPARTRVRVVTDSTAALPEGLADSLGVLVVPLQVHLGAHTGWEGVDVMPGDVAAALRRHEAISTSPPTSQAFTSAYTAASALGREPTPYDVVSVHMSGVLSETAAHAKEGSLPLDYAGVQVEVVDARTTAMGLGFAVLAAARAAAEGHSAKMVARHAEEAARRTDAIFYVDSLDQLRRTGRIGAAQALVGTALSLKPLLHVADGIVAPLERVRGSAKAIVRLEDRIVERCGTGDVQVAVHHLAAPERAADLAVALQRRMPGRILGLSVSEIGAVVGAHVGPGLLGAVVQRMA